MKMNIIGATNRVTGSCTWMKDEALDVEFLVDCGMVQGEDQGNAWNQGKAFPFDPRKIKFVILTHAHLDHCGMIPVLVRRGFRGKVYCTAETEKIATLVLEDAANHSVAIRHKDVKGIRWYQHAGPTFGRCYPVSKDLFIRYSRSGHILGAASVEILCGPAPRKGTPSTQRKVLFSGDIGPNFEGHETQPFMRHVMSSSRADVVVLESTYGASPGKRRLPSFYERQRAWRELLNRALFDRSGVVVVPAFAVGRMQDILFDLTYLFASDPEAYGDIPVFLHAKMAQKANRIYAKYLGEVERVSRSIKPKWLNKRLFEWLGLNPDDPSDHHIADLLVKETLGASKGPLPEEVSAHANPIIRNWRRVFRSRGTKVSELAGPAILLTGSGMMTGGPVVGYVEDVLTDSRNTLVFTGYVGPAAQGGQILALREHSLDERSQLTGDVVWETGGAQAPRSVPLAEIRCTIEKFDGYSGHADKEQLAEWLIHEYDGKQIVPDDRVFLNHGDPAARRGLRDAILTRLQSITRSRPFFARALKVELPSEKSGWYDLDTQDWCEEEGTTEDRLRGKLELISADNNRLLAELAETRRTKQLLEEELKALRGDDPLIERLVDYLIPQSTSGRVRQRAANE